MLEQIFSDELIINYICKERVKLAGQTHDRQYINRLAGNLTETRPQHPFYALMPPRKQWARFRPAHRSDSSSPDLRALRRAVRLLREHQPNQPWVLALNDYIASIRERVFERQPFSIAPPRINWECKNKEKHEYRALCKFDPDDNLILCLFANYLRDAFDPLFSPTSFAFRANRNGKTPTHHDAFTQIFELKHNAPETDLYVAECDIKGFFDTVDHGEAMRVFRGAAQKVSLDPRAEVLFQAYLDCYSFPVNVLAQTQPRLQGCDSIGYFKWPGAELAELHQENPNHLRIGVPQGGAVSGIIANLLMDEADKCVERKAQSLQSAIHYFRFCDDSVLLSRSRDDCQAVFDAYLAILTQLKLVFHSPKKTWVYGKEHWRNKSKAPYCWSGRHWFGCVPWLQFVGYQIRYDGLVRPRKESIRKQCLKLVETTDRLKHGLLGMSQSHPILSHRNQAIASHKAKLVAMGVGRVREFIAGPMRMCWTSGFQGLHNKPLVAAALYTLDKVRKRQLRRFSAASIPYGTGRPFQRQHRPQLSAYKYSYIAQFRNAGGRDLIRHPWKRRNLWEASQGWLFLAFQRQILPRWRNLSKRWSVWYGKQVWW